MKIPGHKSLLLSTSRCSLAADNFEDRNVLPSLPRSNHTHRGDSGGDAGSLCRWRVQTCEPSRDDDVDAISLLAANTLNKFGLSNFKADDVKKIYDFAKSRGYVLPTIYQGNYNPVGRHYDTTLLPLLRELQIAFYAYSPLAGGFLVKDPEMFRSGGGQGRWDPHERRGAIYQHQYNKSKLVEALSEWDSIANDAGVSKAALAYRWVMYNSMIKPEFGDGIIIGASRPQQLEQTLHDIEEGPLEASIAKRIDTVWDSVKDEAPIDNYHSYAIEAGLVSQQG